jgi:aromatic-L-amino-acid decarboxylase
VSEPGGLTDDEFRALGHRMVDWVADYRAGLAARPVMSRVAPGEIRARFPPAPPESGGGLAAALDALETDVLPGITHWNHPSFFAYFPSNTSYASVLADLVAAGIGAQGMSWQTSPAATEIEQVTLDWLRQAVGLSAAWTGVIHDTASTATLTALLCARERALDYAQEGPGLQGEGAPLVVYTSEQAHSSVGKAALLAGFGREHVRLVPTDDAHALRLDHLAALVAEDRARGLRPCAIVATAGSTNSTAFDPLAGSARIAAEHGLWLHVDAAMAGSAMILPECRPLWDGVEGADSAVFNPHKWLGVGCDLSAYYVRDAAHLVRVMSTNPVYLRTEQDAAVVNYRDWQIPLGRRFRALKLWFVFVDVGVEGLRARLRRDLANARRLADVVDAARAEGWERVAPVALQTVCLRHVPPAFAGDEAAIAAHNLEIARSVNESGAAYLTPSVLAGKQILRVSIGALGSEWEHVEALWNALRQVAAGKAQGQAAGTRPTRPLR